MKEPQHQRLSMNFAKARGVNGASSSTAGFGCLRDPKLPEKRNTLKYTFEDLFAYDLLLLTQGQNFLLKLS